MEKIEISRVLLPMHTYLQSHSGHPNNGCSCVSIGDTVGHKVPMASGCELDLYVECNSQDILTDPRISTLGLRKRQSALISAVLLVKHYGCLVKASKNCWEWHHCDLPIFVHIAHTGTDLSWQHYMLSIKTKRTRNQHYVGFPIMVEKLKAVALAWLAGVIGWTRRSLGAHRLPTNGWHYQRVANGFKTEENSSSYSIHVRTFY